MPIDCGVRVKINERSVAIAATIENGIRCSVSKIDAASKKIKKK